MNSGQILGLLAKRHSEDVFVPECKDGPTQSGRGHLRMDAWVMAKSWVSPKVTAYEIKVSRSDFLKDDKHQKYMDYCNEFYFVCPRGLIQPEELSDGCGLVWVSKTGGKLFTKKRAPYRDVTIPESLFRYIIMCRATIGGEKTNGSWVDYWTSWLEEKKEKQRLGLQVSKRIKEIVEATHAKNIHLESLMQNYDDIKQLVIDMGFDPNDTYSDWKIMRKLDAITGITPVHLEKSLSKAISDLSALKSLVCDDRG